MTIAIMAGGRGRRMGRDKTAIAIGGATMLEHVARAALATGRPVMVVGRERPDGWMTDDIPFIPDAAPGCGPIAGIAAALEHTGAPIVALAADMPLITSEAISWLIDAASSTPSLDGLVVMNGGRMEPLFAVYRESVSRMVREMIADDRHALRELIAAGDFARIDAPPEVAGVLRNLNTPEDLESVRRMLS